MPSPEPSIGYALSSECSSLVRLGLLLAPGDFCESLARKLRQRRRKRRLRRSVAAGLLAGHLDCLELLDAATPLGIRVVFDIGANVGTFSLLAKAILPSATVEAFEPLVKHVDEFHRNLAGVEGIRVHSIALGSRNVTAAMRVTAFSDSSSVLRPTEINRRHFGTREITQVPVVVRRLDDYCQESLLPLPDLIKVDVQGYELEVFKGAEGCLRSAKAVIVEASFADYYEDQPLFGEVVEFLGRFNLQLAALGSETATGVPLRQADMLFVRQPVGTRRL